jgi:hypothetical protein
MQSIYEFRPNATHPLRNVAQCIALCRYSLPSKVCGSGVNKGCASDISAVVFLYIVNDNLYKSVTKFSETVSNDLLLKQ